MPACPSLPARAARSFGVGHVGTQHPTPSPYPHTGQGLTYSIGQHDGEGKYRERSEDVSDQGMGVRHRRGDPAAGDRGTPAAVTELHPQPDNLTAADSSMPAGGSPGALPARGRRASPKVEITRGCATCQGTGRVPGTDTPCVPCGVWRAEQLATDEAVLPVETSSEPPPSPPAGVT